VHFEIPADGVARARVFYEKVFGWKIKQFPMPRRRRRRRSAGNARAGF
jgi:predicted enzyme related to lactoylglutathione lyase